MFVLGRAGVHCVAACSIAILGPTTVLLLTWLEFQAMFQDSWFRLFMIPTMREEVDPLIEYTEPINSRISRKADALRETGRARFRELRDRHLALAAIMLPYLVPIPVFDGVPIPALPLRASLGGREGIEDLLPSDVLDARALRQLLDALVRHWRLAIAEFDEVFGERA